MRAREHRFREISINSNSDRKILAKIPDGLVYIIGLETFEVSNPIVSTCFVLKAIIKYRPNLRLQIFSSDSI